MSQFNPCEYCKKRGVVSACIGCIHKEHRYFEGDLSLAETVKRFKEDFPDDYNKAIKELEELEDNRKE